VSVTRKRWQAPQNEVDVVGIEVNGWRPTVSAAIREVRFRHLQHSKPHDRFQPDCWTCSDLLQCLSGRCHSSTRIMCSKLSRKFRESYFSSVHKVKRWVAPIGELAAKADAWETRRRWQALPNNKWGPSGKSVGKSGIEQPSLKENMALFEGSCPTRVQSHIHAWELPTENTGGWHQFGFGGWHHMVLWFWAVQPVINSQM
jgi:hypothetical protein